MNSRCLCLAHKIWPLVFGDIVGMLGFSSPLESVSINTCDQQGHRVSIKVTPSNNIGLVEK